MGRPKLINPRERISIRLPPMILTYLRLKFRSEVLESRVMQGAISDYIERLVRDDMKRELEKDVDTGRRTITMHSGRAGS